MKSLVLFTVETCGLLISSKLRLAFNNVCRRGLELPRQFNSSKMYITHTCSLLLTF